VSTGAALRSKYYAAMVSVICVVVTQQEGYLYHFMTQDLQEPSALRQAAPVTVYPFTAPVIAVAVERFVLHALTETGLETYTLRTGHQFDAVNCMTSVSTASELFIIQNWDTK
jgi:hypothetical protein